MNAFESPPATRSQLRWTTELEQTRCATFIVPCFNEADRLNRDEFARFAGEHPELGFIFVDDGSTDGTWQILNELCRYREDTLSALQLEANSGKAEAVRRGMLAACADETDPPRYVGFLDADLSTPLDALPDFCDALDSRDDLEMVFGARVKLLGREIHRNALRHYIGRVFATAASITLNLPIYDTQCGAKLFRNTDELREVLAEPFLTTWIFDVEIIARYIRLRRGSGKAPVEQVILEMPLWKWEDIKGSKLKLQDFVKGGVDLLRIWRTL